MHSSRDLSHFCLDTKCLWTQEIQCDFSNQNLRHEVCQCAFCDPLGKRQSLKYSLVVKALEFLQHLTGVQGKCTRTGDRGPSQKTRAAGPHNALCAEDTRDSLGSLHSCPPGSAQRASWFRRREEGREVVFMETPSPTCAPSSLPRN